MACDYGSSGSHGGDKSSGGVSYGSSDVEVAAVRVG
jgi:hypothetical protein